MNSMTGFGRGSASHEQATVAVEIAGVNRKQAEVVVLGLRDQANLENRIRKAVLRQVSRGRLQVAVSLQPTGTDATAVHLDPILSHQVRQALDSLADQWGRPIEINAGDLLKFPGLIRIEESSQDPEILWQAIEPALAQAIDQLIGMREAEGRDLADDLQARLAELQRLRDAISDLAPRRPEKYRELLLKRLNEIGLSIDLDDDRVLREVALFADRCDVTEETTRLQAHFKRFHEYLAASEPVGRSLDFLCQEIHREFNTIGSKASDATIAQHVVTAKTELEKIREQVQNVE
jgi:uncharacterized protein (TIGR00255 family)